MRKALEEDDLQRKEAKRLKREREEGETKASNGNLAAAAAAPGGGAGASTSSRPNHAQGDPSSCVMMTMEAARAAQKERTAARKGKGKVKASDLELGDIEAAEEDTKNMNTGGELSHGGRKGKEKETHGDDKMNRFSPEEGEGKFTAFNLDEERAEGRFDREGNYYRNEEKRDEAEVEDAWLRDIKVAPSHQEKDDGEQQQQQQEEEPEPEPEPMTQRQIAHLNMKVADLLHEGETVRSGLLRLSGKKKGKKNSGRGLPPALRKKEKATGTSGDASAENGNRADLEELTSASTLLISVGELDVYSKTKEDFENAASLFMETRRTTFGAGPSSSGSVMGGEKAFGKKEVDMNNDDDDDGGDMFADEDEDAILLEKEKKKPTEEVKKLEEDYASWPISKLKRFLEERGENLHGVTEKGELVSRAKRAAAIPHGFVFDSHSNYYFSHAKQLYYDAASGYYYNGSQWTKEDPSSGAP